jgi:predicted acylesterase/phospholipase RssA
MTGRLQCDLVMRGGITSGIVYPRAIAKLAETYDFRSIGGTSAGAIAATATAAAALGAKSGRRCQERPGSLPNTNQESSRGSR